MHLMHHALVFNQADAYATVQFMCSVYMPFARLDWRSVDTP